MKLWEKLKNISPKMSSRKGKLIGLVLLGAGNIAAVTVTSLAWFNLSTKESKIKMVSGDLDVDIRKVSAYKYVYPYYANSTEFINYDTDGVVKKYVLEDHTLTYNDTNVDEINITSDNANATLDTKYTGTTTDNVSSAASNNIYVATDYVPSFRYYLIGDDLFSGVDTSWSIENAYAFALREEATNEKPAVLNEVVVSAGSSFRLIEAYQTEELGQITYEYNYFPLAGIAESSSSFRIIDDDSDGNGDRLLCLRSGIYTFSYAPNSLRAELHTRDSGTKKDISVITNNSMDPTKISIDYSGSVDKDIYPTINSYVPQAIYEQNTTVVLDVELNFKNANPVDAGLKIERTNASSNSIFNVTNKYEDTANNLVGYVDDSHQNLLRASDFYNYYAKFTKTPYATAEAIWNNMHRVGDNSSQKFINGETYDKVIDCTLNVSGEDSTLVPASNEDNIYHCYISVEYDYEHSVYFLDKNRLGKTYLLDRDFGFHFIGKQHKESV